MRENAEYFPHFSFPRTGDKNIFKYILVMGGVPGERAAGAGPPWHEYGWLTEATERLFGAGVSEAGLLAR
jgi:hypothetical protein